MKMPKLRSLKELDSLREELQKDVVMRTHLETRIIVGMGSCSISTGSREVLDAIMKELAKKGIVADVKTVGCIGMCEKEPLVNIVQGDEPMVTYAHVTPQMIPRMIEEHLIQGKVIQEWVLARLNTTGRDIIQH
jgi:NADP-reducing hydrogenase subunit HndB